MESTIENKLYQVAEIQLTYKSNVKPSQRPRISGSRDAFNILKENWDHGKIEFVEQFKAMFTNRANRVLGILDVSTGGVTGTVADPRVIFAAGIKAGACGVIVAHNHPSGNLLASQSDIELTKRLKEAGKILEIQLLDHVIVTSEGYFSFADEGLI
jgi:DNA repair protein RadC